MTAPDGDYRIRPARGEDGEAVGRELAAYLAHIGATPDPGGLDRDVADWHAEYDGAVGVLLLVEDPAGGVVGTAGVRRLAPGVGELKRMWIRPECRGLGIGRRLLARCLDEARRLGLARVRLDSQRGMAAAIRLYRGAGFREVPDYNGNPRAEIWMEATLEPGGRPMANQAVTELKAKTDAAWANLSRQARGLDAHLDASDAPGEWTVREVLCHLAGEPGFTPSAVLRTFAERDLPVIEIEPGETFVTPERRTASLADLVGALDAQRRDLAAYLDGLGEADLKRKARIPLFKQFMGTDEISIPMFVGAMFDYHWNDHAGQIRKIREAVGLPETR